MRPRWTGVGATALGLLLIATAFPARAEPEVGSVSAVSAPVGGEAEDLDALFDEEFEAAQQALAGDPFEPVNRRFLQFNQVVDRFFFRPITLGYRFLLPEPARRSVRRAFVNVNSPVVLVNDLLQLRFRDAAEALGAFVLNTAFGAGGLFDAAKEAGWEVRHADFGQTLARVGVKSGPYLVVPVLGPSTVRDGMGRLVDLVMHPLTYILGPGQGVVLGGSSGFTKLEEHFDQLRALEESSIDYYAALRSVYLQNRQAEIRGEADGVTHLAGNR